MSRRSTAPPIVVERAEGARITADDGRTYLDFAGGIGCQNLGHGPADVVAAIHEQVDRYLHQCFMVGMYEPYVEVCRRLAELYPGPGSDYKSVLRELGRRGGRERGQDRPRGHRPAGRVAFDRAFHGRTLLTMSLTSKVVPYKRGFGPFAPEVYRVAARRSRRSSTCSRPTSIPRASPAWSSSRCRARAASSPMPDDFPRRLKELCDAHGILYVDDEVQAGVGRTGPVWAIEHYGVTPDLLVSGKSLGGGLPLAGVTGRAELMDAVHVGGLGGTFGGNPVACAAACVVLDTVSTPEFRRRADALGDKLRARLDALAGDIDAIVEVRGLGPMLALELAAARWSPPPWPPPRERGPAPALVRPVRRGDPAAPADHDLRRGPHGRAQRAGGGAARGD